MNQYPVLAIDYGSKRIGLAISDPKGIIASPLKVIRLTEHYNFTNLITELHQIIEEYKVKRIIVGNPESLETGTISEQEKQQKEKNENQSKAKPKIAKFVKFISKTITIPIQLYDENFSTITAQNMLLSTGQHAKKTKKKIDMVASAVFLQEFLSSEQKS